MPISAVDSITPAIEHTRQQLFQNFRIGQWTKLAFVGLLAGELGGNGCNRSNLQIPGHPGPHIGIPGSIADINPAVWAAAIAAILAGLALSIIFMYISSVMRFVLFDSVVSRECHIRWSWNRRLAPGWRLFVWKLLYVVLALAAIAAVIGIPLALAFAKGWLRNRQEHLPALVLGGSILFVLLMAFAVLTAVIFVLTKDFVVPQMALDDIGVMEGWRRLLRMMEAEMGAYIAYIVMKIVLAIVVGIGIAIAAAIMGVIFAIPTIGIGLLAVITGKTAGLVWNVYTITVAVVIGLILLGIFLYFVSLVSVPAIVFFPAYSFYFFAGRYPKLSAALYASASGMQAPSAAPGTAGP